MNILDEIVANKRIELKERMNALPLDELKFTARKAERGPHFLTVLRSVPMGLIAEVKHQSPSVGVIRSPFEPAQIASDYVAGGAQCISVLMDEKYFGGGESHFKEVREAVDAPLLYKEFVVKPWQVWHAASIGASAVLLIVGALTDPEIDSLLECCLSARVEPLCEVHDQGELSRVLAWKPRCIGINNRNLRTFDVSLDTTYRLRDMISDEATVISESGIKTAQDVAALKAAGIHGVLVGEQLLRQENLVDAIKELMGTS